MANWYAVRHIATAKISFATDGSQGFAELQTNPAFSVHAIAGLPAKGEFFDLSDNTIKAEPALPKTQDERDATTLVRRNHADLSGSALDMARMQQLILKKLYGVK